MEMYNADGSRGEMCGNGIRCLGKYVYDRGLTDKRELDIQTGAGTRHLRLFAGEEVPAGGEIRMVEVNMGRPVLEADLDRLALDFSDYQTAVEERQAELADTQTEAMASIIAEQTEAYILDKAGELGAEVTVRVETRTGGDGVPVPWSAELTGARSEALASALETELGIPAERQVWHERNTED